MNFYEKNFEMALLRVTYPQMERFRHKLVFHEKGLAMQVMFQTFNFVLPHSEALETTEMTLRHTLAILYSDIPTNAREAEDFFVEKIFLLHMEVATHEAMESFAVDDMRFRNPHQRGYYEGARKDVDTHTSTSLWRNHVMWEACALVTRTTPPDYRGILDKILDDIVDWDLEMEREIKARVHAVYTHFCNWRVFVKVKFEGWNFLDAARYSLGMAQNMVGSLISGKF